MSNPTHPTLKKIIEHVLRYQQVYLVFLLLIILIIPYFNRYLNNNLSLLGEVSYFHLLAAEQISINNFYQNPYHLLLSLNFTQNFFLYLAVPLILAVFSLLLLNRLSNQLQFNSQNRFFFLFFLILSPAFIYSFTVLTHHSFFIFLSLLGFTLLLSSKKLLKYFSFPVFAVIPFFDVFSAMLTLFFMAVYFYLKKDSLVKTLALVILLFTFINIFLNKTFLLGPYQAQNIFIDFFSNLGGLFGFSMFIILLAITGLMITWKKKKFFLAYIILSILLILSFYQTSTTIYLNFFIAFLASFGFTHFLNKKWKIKVIKNIFLFLLILGILFSTLTSLSNLSELPPSLTLERNFVKINEKVELHQIIFSHPQDSYFIEYFAERPAFIHYHDADFKTKMAVTNQIFESTYIKETFPLLEQNNISYIYLPPQTKADLPPDRGLLFLLQNERFKRIYKRNDIELWKFNEK